MKKIQFNLTAPNLLCICVDERLHGENSGRVYSCYFREAVSFLQEYQLIKITEQLMDSIDHPQASVKSRRFRGKEEKPTRKPEKVMEGWEVAEQRGKLATFLVHNQYRQKATWQGELLWLEEERKFLFRSELELLKWMDHAMEKREILEN